MVCGTPLTPFPAGFNDSGSRDLEVGAFCPLPPPSPITFNDVNGSGAWDGGEDIVLDSDGSGVFD